ncbi:MAG: hypothetical protein K2H12_04705, partial [Acetatifactor sp.]|nr:hypothetical protein [Acetatifactor sp.]
DGTVTNGTDCDFAYMAVWQGEDIMVIENVKAGETVNLQQAEREGRCVYQNRITVDVGDLLLYSSAISLYSRSNREAYPVDEMAALLIGMGVAKEKAPDADCAIIAGLMRGCDRVTVGKCNETSYGCLYGYAETEV